MNATEDPNASGAILVKTRRELQPVITPVVTEANSIRIADAQSYTLADNFLKRVKTAGRTIDDKLDPIIAPIRGGLDKLYELKRELHKPLDEAEVSVKSKMKDWQIAERKRIAAEEEENRKREERLRRLAEEEQREAERLEAERIKAELRAENAKTQAARRKAEAEAVDLLKQQRISEAAADRFETRAEAAAEKEVEGPTKASGSRVREVKKWRITSKTKLIKAVAEGKAPQEVLAVESAVLNRYLREDPESLSEWPGVELYTDVQIAGM